MKKTRKGASRREALEKMKKLWTLFFTMLKIGAFTFGGGYAMIALLQRELTERHGWLTDEEFLDLVAIAESTPGPIAINSSTYVGYRVAGVAGAAFATLGMCLPSFVIIFAISLFFDAFLSLQVVSMAFAGIRACVCYLILSAGIKMIRALPKKKVFPVILLTLTVAGMLFCTAFAVSFSTIYYILIGAAAGLCVWGVGQIRRKEGGK